MSLLYTPSLLEAARKAAGFLGNPDLHKKVTWGKISKENNTYIATHVAKRDVALPFSIIGIIDPSDKMYLHALGNWSSAYSSAADLVKSKLSFLLGAPEDPLLSQLFTTAADNIAKIEGKSPFSANTPIANSVVNNLRPITFRMSSAMFVKKDATDTGKPKGFEHIDYDFKSMEEEWADGLAGENEKKMWRNAITDHHFNPLNAWDTEGGFYVPPDYTSVLPSALVEVHFEIRMHRFTNGRTFSTQVKQLIVWVEGEAIVPCDGDSFSSSHTGPYRYILDDDDDDDDTNKEANDSHEDDETTKGIEDVQDQEDNANIEKDAHESEEQVEEYEHIEAPQHETEEESADMDTSPIARATTPLPAAVAEKAPVTPMKKLAVTTTASTPSPSTNITLKTSPAKRSIRAVQGVQSAEGSPAKRATIKVRPQATTTSPAEAAKTRNNAKKSKA